MTIRGSLLVCIGWLAGLTPRGPQGPGELFAGAAVDPALKTRLLQALRPEDPLSYEEIWAAVERLGPLAQATVKAARREVKNLPGQLVFDAALGWTRSEAAEKQLLETLRHPTLETEHGVVAALALSVGTGGPVVVKELLEVAGSRRPEALRVACLVALARLGGVPGAAGKETSAGLAAAEILATSTLPAKLPPVTSDARPREGEALRRRAICIVASMSGRTGNAGGVPDPGLADWLHRVVKQSTSADERRAAAFAIGTMQAESEPELELLDGSTEVAEAFLAGFRHPRSVRLMERLAPGPGASRPPSLRLVHAVTQARGGELDAEIRRMGGKEMDASVQRVVGLVLARRILDGERLGVGGVDVSLLGVPGGGWVVAASKAPVGGPGGTSLPEGRDQEAVLVRKALRGELSVKAMMRVVDRRLREEGVMGDGYRGKLVSELMVDLLCGGSAWLLQKRLVIGTPADVPYLPKGPPASNDEYFRVLVGLVQRVGRDG